VGAALASHGRSHRFDPCHAHQHKHGPESPPRVRLPADCQQTTFSVDCSERLAALLDDGRSSVAAGHPEGTRSALDPDGGQVAAHLAGNRPVRVRVQGSRTRRRRRGRSSPFPLYRPGSAGTDVRLVAMASFCRDVPLTRPGRKTNLGSWDYRSVGGGIMTNAGEQGEPGYEGAPPDVSLHIDDSVPPEHRDAIKASVATAARRSAEASKGSWVSG
jgi:hypothetical protein